MKKLLIALTLVAFLGGTAFAGHGGGRHGGWRGGGGCNNRGSNDALWIGMAGLTAACLIGAVLSQPQQRTVVREVVPVAPAAYVRPAYQGGYGIVACSRCGRQAACGNVPPGYRAACPHCGQILF